MRVFVKVFSVAITALVVIYALGPANWAFRTGLGWQVEHFLGYFAITSLACLAWPRPVVVGGAIVAGAALLEGLQGLTPDRIPHLPAALLGAGGALTAAVLAELLIRTRRRWTHAKARA